jgi:prepilin-type N-terminal cleavage/methylation domain-containing protein
MKTGLNNRGVSLIELLIVMAILGFLTVMMVSSYALMVKYAIRTRVTAKTEGESITVIWPLFKEVESAGFGVPSSGTCTPAISLSGDTLTIHSTASGDEKGSGSWSFISDGCAVDNTSVSKIAFGQYAVVIDPGSKARLALSNIQSSTYIIDYPGSECTWVGKLAYRVPDGGLECYETKFTLRSYASGSRPNLCDTNTFKLTRSVAKDAGNDSFQPVADCVLTLKYRFGCINKTSGALTWRADSTCTASEGILKFVRVGMLIQATPKIATQEPASITLFQDAATPETITLTSDQRYYKWKMIDRTIPLRNM